MKKIVVFLFFILSSIAAVCQDRYSNKIKISDVLVVRLDADEEPRFSGGEGGWITFLRNNLRTGVGAVNNAPAGTYYVTVNFAVDTSGNPLHIMPQTCYGYGLEKEAIRVLQLSKWMPGSIRKQPVCAQKKLTITFVVAQKPLAI